MLKIKNNQKGFTLIELLVVVAIISLLSSVVMASLNTARAKARDAKRKSDLHQIANAIYLYMSDHNFAVPNDNGGLANDSFNTTGDWLASNPIVDLVTQNYIPVLPKDPKNDGTYNYAYEPGDISPPSVPPYYNACLLARLEVPSSPASYIVVRFGPPEYTGTPPALISTDGYDCPDANTTFIN